MSDTPKNEFAKIRAILAVLPGGGHVTNPRIVDCVDDVSTAAWLAEYKRILTDLFAQSATDHAELVQLRADLVAVRRVLGVPTNPAF